MALRSVCPQIYGLFAVKLACLLMLIGGVPRLDASGTAIRGEVHMLLVGDPGTGALTLGRVPLGLQLCLQLPPLLLSSTAHVGQCRHRQGSVVQCPVTGQSCRKPYNCSASGFTWHS